jgi:hypothetical protein
VEEREDGVYLKVTPKQRDMITIHAVGRALHEAMVTNFDLHAIEDVVKRARGEFERIGPPFDYYDPAFDEYVRVRVQPLSAAMFVSSEVLTKGLRPTRDRLLYCLGRKGLCYGIDEEAIEAFAAKPHYDVEVAIAKGKAPRQGRDGEVELLVKIDPDARPSVDERGRVDYRDIHSFTTAKEDQPLARLLPPEEGEPGIAVSGEEIPAKGGKNAVLPQGKNTRISDDGLSLLAGKAGVVYEEGGLIHIGELLQIDGNVDYSVGNIKYSGDVVIMGDVKPGFTIESEGDIRIGGEIEAARVISRNGTVDVGRGVIGKNDTLIAGRTGVRVGFAQEATIASEGTVTVDKYCLHCAITCRELETAQADSSIVGGQVRAYDHLTVANIGSDSAVPTKIALVNKQKLQALEKLKELGELKGKIEKELEPLTRDLRGKSAIMKKAGGAVGERHRQDVKKLVDSYNALGRKARYIDGKVAELKEVIESDTGTDGYIKVTRNIYPGAEIDLYGIAHKTITTTMTAKVFRTKAGSIETEG